MFIIRQNISGSLAADSEFRSVDCPDNVVCAECNKEEEKSARCC